MCCSRDSAPSPPARPEAAQTVEAQRSGHPGRHGVGELLDQLVFELELLQLRRGVCKMKGVGRVDGKVVAEAKIMARIMDR